MTIYPNYDCSIQMNTHYLYTNVRVLRDGEYWLFPVRVDTTANTNMVKISKMNFELFIKAVYDVFYFGDHTVQIDCGNGITKGAIKDEDQTPEIDRLRKLKDEVSF